jgi:cyclomaltodextrinase
MSIEWFRNAVIYQILIDRFAGYKSTQWDTPDFLGGNLRGIIEKLGYIKDLGVNTIWISPFNQASAYHGYHITDFYKVEPRFGSEQDLRDLINAVHNMDMKIITDFVPNHCSNQHPFFLDAQNNRDSVYKDWFYFRKWPDNYLCFLSFGQLPKLNLDNEEARKHIIDAAKYWLSFGIDGYRLDHCIGPKHEFWKIFREKIKSDFPDCVLVGEATLMGIKLKELRTINTRRKYIHYLGALALDNLFEEYIGELDGVLDFKFQSILRDFAVNKITKDKAINKLRKHYEKFPPDFYLASFLDNHDMDRFLYTCRGDKELLKEAAKIQFSINQPKIIYYGTEVGISQEKTIGQCPAHGDLQARAPMEWENPDKELLEFYRKIITNGV